MKQLQGVATIQLFNAKTGELEQEVKEHNMITNVIDKVLNPPDYLRMGLNISSDSSINIRPYVNSISDSFFNGVMVFEDNITEDADIVMPPFDNKEIGHAGRVSSSSLSHVGSYNENESGEITNGYRRVWDFGTDKANGDISCVCLTSRAGGSLGVYRQEALSGGGRTLKSETGDDNGDCWTIKDEHLYNDNPLNIRQNTYVKFFYMERQSNGNIKILAYIDEAIVEIIIGNPFKLSLFSKSCEILSYKVIYTLGKERQTNWDWYENGYEEDPGDSVAYDEIDNLQTTYQTCVPYVYNNKIHIISCGCHRTQNTLRHIILNIDTYKGEQNKTINVPYTPYNTFYYNYYYDNDLGRRIRYRVDNGLSNRSYKGAFFYDGHYFYCDTNKRMVIVDSNGNITQTIDNINLTHIYIDEENNFLIGSESDVSYKLGVYFIRKVDGKYQFNWNSLQHIDAARDSNTLVKVKEMTLPLYIFGNIYQESNPSATYITIFMGCVYPFISTINNLSTKVRKTDTQTMKITYDITESN